MKKEMSMRASAKTAKHKYLILGRATSGGQKGGVFCVGFFFFLTLEVIHDNMLSYFLLCICNF